MTPATEICVVCLKPARRSGWCARHEKEFGITAKAPVRVAAPSLDADEWEADPLEEEPQPAEPEEAPPVIEDTPAEPAMTEPVEKEAIPREQVRDIVRRELQRSPRPGADEVRATVERETGHSISRSNFYASYLTPIAKELGIARRGNHDGKRKLPSQAGIGAPKPRPVVAEPEPPPPAPVVEVPPPPTAKELALSEEVRSLRSMYEADDAFSLRVVEEGDGAFRVVASVLLNRLGADSLVREIARHGSAVYHRP